MGGSLCGRLSPRIRPYEARRTGIWSFHTPFFQPAYAHPLQRPLRVVGGRSKGGLHSLLVGRGPAPWLRQWTPDVARAFRSVKGGPRRPALLQGPCGVLPNAARTAECAPALVPPCLRPTRRHQYRFSARSPNAMSSPPHERAWIRHGAAVTAASGGVRKRHVPECFAAPPRAP
jgi:hypothetical protein